MKKVLIFCAILFAIFLIIDYGTEDAINHSVEYDIKNYVSKSKAEKNAKCLGVDINKRSPPIRKGIFYTVNAEFSVFCGTSHHGNYIGKFEYISGAHFVSAEWQPIGGR